MDRSKLSNEELRALAYEEARAAEESAERDEDDGAPLPAGTKVSRPNREKVLHVRLSASEFEALEALAAGRDLKVSTLARDHLLKLIQPVDPAAGGSWASLARVLAEASEALRVAESTLPAPLKMDPLFGAAAVKA